MNKTPCPERAIDIDTLKDILGRISFQKSCVDFEWDWQIDEVYTVKKVPAGYPDPSTVPIPRYTLAYEMVGWHVNTTFKRPDINTGKIGTGAGRKLFVEKNSSASAVFFTCWILVDLIVKHELMEAIRFDDKRVLNPHHSLAELSLPDLLKQAGIFPGELPGILDVFAKR